MLNKKGIRASLLLCFAVLLILIFVCGCGKSETEDVVEITLMHGWGGTLQTHKIMQEIYEEFDRRNEDIKLNCIPYSNNAIAVKKANDMLAVGKTADILSTNGLSYYVMNAAKAEAALDLMPYINADPEWKSQIHPAVFDTWMTDDGKLYTIPDALEVAGYWYNETYFKRAGIVNAQGKVVVPRTWEEFMNMVERLQNWIDETDQEITVFALEEQQIMEFVFLARLAGESEEGLMLASDADIGMDDQLFDTVYHDILVMKQHSSKVKNLEDARQSFRNGKSIIYFNGVWEADELSKGNASADIQYTNYPTASGESLSYISASSGYVLASQTDERKEEACIRFMKYILSDEVQEKIALRTGQAPSNPNIRMENIKEESSLLGSALAAARMADVQIETIRSAWDEESLAQIERKLGY